jgi:hypothetical protein
MAAEARRKCQEANELRVSAIPKSKKKRAKRDAVQGGSAGKVFDFESAAASAPTFTARSIDD